MSLPSFAMQITRHNDGPLISSLCKNFRTLKKDETGYLVYLIADLVNNEWQIEFGPKATQRSHTEYYYFGNNSGSSAQHYLTRAIGGEHYLFTATLGKLYEKVLKHNINGELKVILEALDSKGLYSLKKGRLNYDRFKQAEIEAVKTNAQQTRAAPSFVFRNSLQI